MYHIQTATLSLSLSILIMISESFIITMDQPKNKKICPERNKGPGKDLSNESPQQNNTNKLPTTRHPANNSQTIGQSNHSFTQ